MSWNHWMTRGALGLTLATIALAPWVAPGRTAEAATLTVTKTADTNDGVCAADCSLREAINAASAGDIVSVPAGTYTLSIAGVGENAGATGDLDVLVNLTIDGAGAGLTTIDGGALDNVIEVVGTASLTLDGVTVRNGAGNGVNATSGNVTVNSSSITDNAGGGINTYGGNVSVANSTIGGNSNTGINTYSGNVSVDGSTVTNNGGGGINTYAGNVLVDASTVNVNGGGGVNTSGGNIDVTGSAIDGNSNTGINTSSGDVSVDGSTVIENGGGGVNTSGGNIDVSDSTVSGNSDSGLNTSSGNVLLDGSTVSDNGDNGVSTSTSGIAVVNSTISGNFDTNVYTSSGAIQLTNVTVANSLDGDGVANGGGTTTMLNTIVAGHGGEGADCSVAGTIGGGYNLDGDGSCPFGGSGNISSIVFASSSARAQESGKIRISRPSASIARVSLSSVTICSISGSMSGCAETISVLVAASAWMSTGFLVRSSTGRTA